jgi:hypothetical protein
MLTSISQVTRQVRRRRSVRANPQERLKIRYFVRSSRPTVCASALEMLGSGPKCQVRVLTPVTRGQGKSTGGVRCWNFEFRISKVERRTFILR